MIGCPPHREGDLDDFALVALSVWGAGAAALLATAAVAYFALPRRIGRVGAAVLAGLGLAAGVVAVNVAPPGPGALIGTALPEPRPAFAAGALLAEAEEKLNRGDSGGARESLSRALDQFRSTGDFSGQGEAVLGMGRVEHLTGQADAARAQYAAALELFRGDGNGAGEARTLVAMGDLAADTFHWRDAVRYFAEGRQAWARVPGPKSDSHVMLKLDSVAAMPDGEAEAWAVLDQAGLIFQNIADDAGIADVAMLRADLHVAVGNPHAALSAYALAAYLYGDLGDRAREARATIRAAAYDVQEGHNAEAAMRLARADAILADLGDPPWEAMAEQVHGDLARLLGDMSAAAARYAAAADRFRAIGDPAEATALMGLGEVHAFAGELDEAARAFGAAAEIRSTIGDAAGLAATHLSLGLLSAASGDTDSALVYWSSAAALAGDAGEARNAGRAHLRLAEAAAAAGDARRAEAEFAAAAGLFADAGVQIGAVLTALGRGELAARTPAADAAAEVRAAAAALAAIDDPVAEGNRFLGLPPVGQIVLLNEINQGFGGDEPDPAAILRAAAEREENLAAHPNHNLEGKRLVAGIVERIAAAQAAN